MRATPPLSHEANWAAVAGVLGALLLFCGDMLFYGHFGAGDQFRAGMIETVRHASLTRLYPGGLVGPIAAEPVPDRILACARERHCSQPLDGAIAFLACAAMMVAERGSCAVGQPRPRNPLFRHATHDGSGPSHPH